MNMNTHTSTRELYRNRDNSPLDRNQVRRVAPSVFADREGSSSSELRNSVPGNRTAPLPAST